MSDLATQAVIAFCIVLGIWFVVGWQMNRRHGRRLLEWIIRGLRASGGQITASRLGLSGFQVNVHDAQAPFKSIETTVLLQPREILLLWIFNLLRGGADYFVLNGTLRASPRGEVEVTSKGGSFAKPLLKELNEKTWTSQETDSGLIIASRGKQGEKLAEAISPLVEDLRPRLLRLSLSKKAPHLLVNLSLADLDEQSALLLLSSLRDLAQTVAGGRR
ncbi:MAG: hypothetical protein CEE40_11115 [Chloroflexi bacterium B3_Chlor]|nr:MAG: hypothetical protein CEE40_11115 [Chloroflexi bacterium B3_Chlor]